MLKFLRISTVYPEVLKQFNKDYPNVNKLSFKKYSKLFFDQYYNQSNFLTSELKKYNYDCMEFLSNDKLMQEKWINYYGNKDSDEDILIQIIKYFKPQILFFDNINLVNDELIKKIKLLNFIKLILGFHCSPINSSIKKNINRLDAMVTCTPGYKKILFNKYKKKTLLMPHAFSIKTKIKKKIKRDIDVSFIGSLFLGSKLHNKRIDLIYDILKNFKNSYVAINFSKYFFYQIIVLLLISLKSFNLVLMLKRLYKLSYIYLFSKGPIFGKNMYKILNRSKILVNMHISDTKHAGNMRMFEGTGCGCLLITDKIMGNKSYFDNKVEIIEYDQINKVINMCFYFLSNKNELKKISTNGKKKTFECHNYETRAKLLDNFIRSKFKVYD